jgi:cyclophilin family peptidyl-prolyl cis-trans isomerase
MGRVTSTDVEMHSIEKPQQLYRDKPPDPIFDITGDIDPNEEVAVLDVMSCTNNAQNNNSKRLSILPKVRVSILALIALVLLIVGVSYGKGNGLTSKPIATFFNDFSNKNSNETTLQGSIIEFTVANLNTNRGRCTYLPSRRLECVPNHDNSTNKFRIQLHPPWSPRGVARFEELTRAQFWNEVRIFRVVPQFVSQFGLSSYPSIQKEWVEELEDDQVIGSNVRGTVTFATSGENTRTTQIFINTADNTFLDRQGFSPIGEVLDGGNEYGGMEVVDEFYAGYGQKPDQGFIRSNGLEYLNDNFPNLSFFVKAEFVQ